MRCGGGGRAAGCGAKAGAGSGGAEVDTGALNVGLATRFRMTTRAERWRWIDAAVDRVRPEVFRAISSADVRRWMAWGRSVEGRRNSVVEQIRAGVARGRPRA